MSERGWSPGPCLTEASAIMLGGGRSDGGSRPKSGVPASLAGWLLEEISA
jgi:hypothetical protein